MFAGVRVTGSEVRLATGTSRTSSLLEREPGAMPTEDIQPMTPHTHTQQTKLPLLNRYLLNKRLVAS